MVQGVTFDKQLMASEDFAHQVNYFYQGKMGVSKGCEISTNVDGNLVVSGGYFSIYGRLLKNVGDTVIDVPTIPSGTLYSALVFEVDLTKENAIDAFNQGQFKIVSNAVTYPTLIQEDLDNGGKIYQLEFARFENTVSGIVDLQDKRTILSMQMYTPQDDFNTHLAEKVAYVYRATINASVASGSQKIVFGFKPDAVEIQAAIHGTARFSTGYSNGVINRCIHTMGDTHVYGASDRIVYMFQSGSEGIDANAVMEEDGITLNWTRTGTSLTGDIQLIIMAFQHGGV